MRTRLLLPLLLVTPILICGCNPGVKVKKNPLDNDTGIRYYRPKPYLVIKPSGTSRTTGSGDDTATVSTPGGEFVEISLEYLPDFAEEYSIKVRPGLGTAKVEISLEQGWNLTQLNQELDSKFADNVKAIADLVKAGGEAVATSTKLPEGAGKRTQKWVVAATNVPIGYYEAVIGEDNQGKKRHYGWRYVGFAPFNNCPTDMFGYDTACCDEYNAAVFGLVFEQGVMRFKQLNKINEGLNLKRVLVDDGTVTISPPETTAKALLAAIARAAKDIAQMEDSMAVVTAVLRADEVVITVYHKKGLDETALKRIKNNVQTKSEIKEPLKKLGVSTTTPVMFKVRP